MDRHVCAAKASMLLGLARESASLKTSEPAVPVLQLVRLSPSRVHTLWVPKTHRSHYIARIDARTSWATAGRPRRRCSLKGRSLLPQCHVFQAR
jgi:hypothetical protein